MKKLTVLLCLLLTLGLSGQADPNKWIREIGDKKIVTGGDGARLVAMLIGSEQADASASIRLLRKKGVIKGDFTPGKPLSTGALSLLIMRAKGFKGGLFYSLFGGGRYAYREMIYKKYLPPGSSEYTLVSGGLLLSVIAAVHGDVKLEMKGGGK